MIMLTEIMMIMIMNTMMTRVAQIELNEIEINGYLRGEKAENSINQRLFKDEY